MRRKIKHFRFLTIVMLFSYYLPNLLAQQNRTSQYNAIYAISSCNYYPQIAPYTFFNELSSRSLDDINLNFLTANSGTFTIEDGETILIERSHQSIFPSHQLTVGAGVQIVKPNGTQHTAGLTKLSTHQSDAFITLTFYDSLGDVVSRSARGFDERSFTVAIRYEFGKYFGRANADVRFGIGIGVEPSFYAYRRLPYTSFDSPVTARIFNLHFSPIPMLHCKLSQKLAVEFKVIPNWLVTDAAKVQEENPVLLQRQQIAIRSYDAVQIDWNFGLLLKYLVQVPKKKRRR